MPTPEARRQRRNVAILAITMFTLTLIVNAVVATLLIIERARTESYTECTAEWQQQFSIAYEARQNAAEKRNAAAARVSAATDEVITAVAQEDRDKFEASLDDYLRVRAEQNKVRAALDEELRTKPLPPFPETVCGGAP